MAARGSLYEEFIRSLIENVKEAGRDIRDLNHGGKNRIVGKSGQAHQIDVSFADHSFQNPKLVLISCKDLSSRSVEPVDVKEWKFNMDDIAEAVRDTGIPPIEVLGMIVTTKGFAKGANLLATWCGINMEIVAHGSEYVFRYQDFVQMSLVDGGIFGDECEIEVYMKCEQCGASFKVIHSERRCSACS